MSTELFPGIAFSPQATLTGSIGAADTIIEVSDVTAFPPAPNLATIGTDEEGETILYTAKTGSALSGCQRGVEGSARAWKSGEVIGRNFTAKDHADLIAAVSETREAAEAAQSAASTAESAAKGAQEAAAAAEGTAAQAAETASTAAQNAAQAAKDAQDAAGAAVTAQDAAGTAGNAALSAASAAEAAQEAAGEALEKVAAGLPVRRAVILAAAGWTGSGPFMQTAAVEGVRADEAGQMALPTPAVNSITAWNAAGVQCTAQEAGKLTFTAQEKPAADIHIFVVLQEVAG